MELDKDRELTRTGVRRTGDDYQDIVGLAILIEWLEHPTRFNSMRVEADDAGYLDDIVVQRSNGVIVFRQVKYSAHPDRDDDPWTWETLLATRKGKKKADGTQNVLPSLIGKWGQSCQAFLNNDLEFEVEIVSNRRAGTDFETSLNNGFVELDRISDPSIKNVILAQFGDEQTAKAVFAKLRFRLDQAGLEVFEASVLRRFLNLGGNEFGWLKLNQAFRRWVRNRNEPESEGEITLRDVRLAAQWFRLQGLPQKFAIPEDYVLPSQQFHEEVVDRVTKQDGTCHVLVGTPGVGKSTFASHLYEHLKDNKHPVIRHHYFFSLTERISYRLDHQKAAESLMHDLLHGHSEALGHLVSANPNPLANDLRTWIETCGKFYLEQGTCLVIIIDGLDHVWRERRSIEELRKLVDMLLPCPSGISIFFATQPVDDKHFPASLLRDAPRKTWLELPLLDVAAVGDWLRFHQSELEFAEEGVVPDHILNRVANSLFNKSGGHPLHLRYTTRTLQERGQIINAENIDNLPACPHSDISVYYDELWNALTEEARLILHLLASCDFAWPPNGLMDCLTDAGIELTKVTSSIKEVSHLLIAGDMGVQPYHGSLVAHIRSKPDQEHYESRTRQLALSWLSGSAPDYWRWAYEWLTRADLDDNEPLLNGPSREWLLDSIRKARPVGEIEEILARCTWCALQKRDLRRAIEVGSLAEYCHNALNYHDYISNELLFPQLAIHNDEFLKNWLRANIRGISDSAVRDLAESEFRDGDCNRVATCLFELTERLRTSHRRYSHRVQKTWTETVEPILNVAAMCGTSECQRTLKFIERNRSNKYCRKMLEFYLSGLRQAKDVGSMREILQFYLAKVISEGDETTPLLSQSEARILGRQSTILALELKVDLADCLRASQCDTTSYSVIFHFFNSGEAMSCAGFSALNQKILSVSGYSHHDKRDQTSSFFCDTFFNLVANQLTGNEESTRSFLEAVGTHSWAREFVYEIGHAAMLFANSISEHQQLNYSWIFENLTALPLVPWRTEDRTDHEYGHSAKRAVMSLSFDVFVILCRQHPIEIRIEDLKVAFATSYCEPSLWIEEYVEKRRCWLTDEAVDWLIETQVKELNTEISEFMNRAQHLILLAKLAAIHRKTIKADELLQLAITNLVSHGDHKDMLLSEALEVVSICHREYDLKGHSEIPTKDWLFKLATPVAQVNIFTNGDHTKHLPSKLSEHLACVSPEYLPVYYRWLDSTEQPNHALESFHQFLKICDLSDSINQSIAATAVDPNSLRILANREAKKDAGAKRVLDNSVAFLGEPARPSLDAIPKRASEKENEILNSSEDQSPPIDRYPPAQFSQFVHDLSKVRFADKTRKIDEWSEHWINCNKVDEVISAQIEVFELGSHWVDLDKLFNLVLKNQGSEKAFIWLARAHRKNNGWSRYWTEGKESATRLDMIDAHYRDRWFAFVHETLRSFHGSPWSGLMIGHSSWVRLVEYCFRMGQPEIAIEIAGQMIESTLELCSAQTFPIPDWTQVEIGGCTID